MSVDIGCGTGTVAAIISKAFPHVQCMDCDLPHIDIVASLLDSKRMNYDGGDMLVSIPFVDAILIMVCNFVVYTHLLIYLDCCGFFLCTVYISWVVSGVSRWMRVMSG